MASYIFAALIIAMSSIVLLAHGQNIFLVEYEDRHRPWVLGALWGAAAQLAAALYNKPALGTVGICFAALCCAVDYAQYYSPKRPLHFAHAMVAALLLLAAHSIIPLPESLAMSNAASVVFTIMVIAMAVVAWRRSIIFSFLVRAAVFYYCTVGFESVTDYFSRTKEGIAILDNASVPFHALAVPFALLLLDMLVLHKHSEFWGSLTPRRSVDDPECLNADIRGSRVRVYRPLMLAALLPPLAYLLLSLFSLFGWGGFARVLLGAPLIVHRIFLGAALAAMLLALLVQMKLLGRGLHGLYATGIGHYGKKDYAAAASCFQRAASKGYPPAYDALGVMHYYGKGMERDRNAGVELLQRAAGAGDACAAYRLGVHFESVEEDYATAARWFEKSGSDASTDHLVRMYYDGRGVKQSYSKALALSTKHLSVANKYMLAEMYSNGRGVGKDGAKASEYIKSIRNDGYDTETSYMRAVVTAFWYSGKADEGRWAKVRELLSAAERSCGDELAQTVLAGGMATDMQLMVGLAYYRAYYNEDGNPRQIDNFVRAVMWLTKAAERGNVRAQSELGTLLYMELGQADMARVWLKKAVEAGDESAKQTLSLVSLSNERKLRHAKEEADDPFELVLLGNEYVEGEHGDDMRAHAAELFEKALELDGTLTVAMVSLAQMYIDGDVIGQNVGKAIDLLTRASDAGDADASATLGGMYADDELGIMDRAKSLKYLRKSAGQGSEETREFLDSLEEIAKERGVSLEELFIAAG